MTLEQLLEWTDAVRPSPWTNIQKTAWISDLEAQLWTEILLRPLGGFAPYRWGRDGGRRLLLPDGWRRVYTAYLGAMIDFANGEFTQYENSMSLYNGCLNELGAWYAAAFDPAGRPARRVGLALADWEGLSRLRFAGEAAPDSALLAAEWRVLEPFDGDGVLSLRTADGAALYEVDITNNLTGGGCRPALIPPGGRDGTVYMDYAGDELGRGVMELWLLEQPAAKGR